MPSKIAISVTVDVEALSKLSKRHNISSICNKALWKVIENEEIESRTREALEDKARLPIVEELKPLVALFQQRVTSKKHSEVLLSELLMAQSKKKFPLASAFGGISNLVQQLDKYKWIDHEFQKKTGVMKVTKKG